MSKIRLLEKSEIAKGKATEQAKEVSEGLKVSRKVDALRELKAREEAELEKFRKATLSHISKDIKDLDAKKALLSRELADLRQDIESESTLTKRERLHLEELKASLELKQETLEELGKELAIWEIELKSAQEDVDDLEKKARIEAESVKNLKAQAEDDRSQAQQLLKDARTVEQRVMQSKDEAEKYFEMRESSLSSREKSVITQQDENGRIARENAIEKVKIADEWAQIQRAAERLRQGRNI